MTNWIWISKRFIALVGVVFGVVLLSFLLLHAIPGDIAYVLAGESASEADIQRIREKLGLDRPIYVQLAAYVAQVARGDLGQALLYRVPVLDLIVSRLPVTITIAAFSLVFGLLLGLPLGLLAAIRRGSALDASATVISLVGICSPSFWRGIVLILVFALLLGWLPPGGLARTGSGVWTHLSYFILPGITMGLNSLGQIARVTRSSVLDTLGEDYIRTARAKGISGVRVLFVHALRNAMLPIITVVGLNFGGLLSGVVVTENVFAIPGLGTLAVNSIMSQDFPVLLGVVLFTSVMFSALNFLVDVIYVFFDPRVSYT